MTAGCRTQRKYRSDLGREEMGHLPSALLSSTSGQAVLSVTVLSSECLPRVSTAYKVNLQHSKKTGYQVVTLEKALEGGTQNHSTGAVAKEVRDA